MPKIPECDSLGRLCHCYQYFVNSPYMVCSVNPWGPEGSTCEDFTALSKEAGEIKEPIGGGYYLGDWIPQPFPTLTADEQLALLDCHPHSTGRRLNFESVPGESDGEIVLPSELQPPS